MRKWPHGQNFCWIRLSLSYIYFIRSYSDMHFYLFAVSNSFLFLIEACASDSNSNLGSCSHSAERKPGTISLENNKPRDLGGIKTKSKFCKNPKLQPGNISISPLTWLGWALLTTKQARNEIHIGFGLKMHSGMSSETPLAQRYCRTW